MRSAEHQVPEAIKHNRATHAGQALHDVRMIANHDIRTRGNRPIRHFLLEVVVLIVVLRAPVAGIDDVIAVRLFKRLDLIGHGGAVLMPHALADAGKADLHAVLFKDVRIGIAAVGDARALQGIAGGAAAAHAVINIVIIGDVGMLHRGGQQDVDKAGGPPEVIQPPVQLVGGIVLEHGFQIDRGVIILAATNRVDVLDKALLRAGRFDRQIHVDLPDLNERKEVFGVHLRPIKIDNTVDVDLLARQTPGFSGADIANVCNEAALIAARHGKKFVGKQDFLDAVDRIVGGLEKKTKITTEAERRSIAIHEAGHASISWLLEYANPLIKVTIVPRGRALGAAWYLPEERQITTKEQMLDEMCATLGGRAAEDLFLGRISTGAMNDLERVTKQAFGMIAYLGMSEKLPNLCYYNNEEYSFNRPYSEKTAELIDEEVKNMVNEQYERAKKILSDHKDGHQRLSQLLIDREVIFAEDVEEIFGKRPWASRSEEISANKISEDLKKAEEAAAKEAAKSEKEVKAEEENNVESGNETGNTKVSAEGTKVSVERPGPAKE